MKTKKLTTTFIIPDYDTHFENNPEILSKKNYQYKSIRDALLFCKQRRIAIDIGAHIGLLTYQMLTSFKKIHTFEACFDNFNCLIQNIKTTKVLHNNIALSDKIEELKLTKHKNNSGAHTCTDLLKNKNQGMETVKAILFDSLNIIKIDFIKIDVEGWDLKVLKGAENSIKAFRPVVLVEDNFGRQELRDKREDNSEIQEYLRTLGMIYGKRHGANIIYYFK